ncbi:MAG: carbohydrate porin, partial [Desulfarculales bacterium]|nr:carbohydrate porin [Desulfarculales bacterium]
GITNGDNSGGPADNGVELRYAYGWWNVGNCKLLVGQMDGRLGDGGALQALGNDKSGKGGLAGFGFIGATRNPRITLEVEANDNVAFQIGLGQAGAETTINLIEGSDAWGSTQNYLPRLEAVVDFTFENISFGLGAGISYQKAEYNDFFGPNFADSSDDSVLSYLLWIPIEFNYGPFSAVLNAHYGRNVDTDWTGENTTDSDFNWNPNGVYGNQPGSLPVGVMNLATNTMYIEDTTQWGIGLDLNFELREDLVLGLGGGFTYLSNDGWAGNNYPGLTTNYGNDSYHRWGAYVALAYAATDNFTIQPEIGYYNYGDRVGVETFNGVWVHPLPEGSDDAGDEWIFGVHFSFNF